MGGSQKSEADCNSQADIFNQIESCNNQYVCTTNHTLIMC